MEIRETGVIIQPIIFWLAASPDGLINDKSSDNENTSGLVEIKCPKSKRSATITELLADKSFYLTKVHDELVLKKDHPNGYYTQIQMAMGLAGASFCDFVVYTHTGMIIVRTPFDKVFFIELIKQLNTFYKSFMLPKCLKNIDD